MLPEGYPGLVQPRDPAAAAVALRRVALAEDGIRFRTLGLARFGLDAHLRRLAEVLHSVQP
jgi:hypothetical protein